MQIRHLPRCPVLDNVGSIRLASLVYILCLWIYVSDLRDGSKISSRVILYPIISCTIIVDAFYAGNYSTFVRGSLHRTESELRKIRLSVM